jgi:N-carbamoylputrescine amidase
VEIGDACTSRLVFSSNNYALSPVNLSIPVELLFYPTAIGSELDEPEFDSKGHWQMVMRGHAAANILPAIASNRIGEETSGDLSLQFYGSSFILNHVGDIVC